MDENDQEIENLRIAIAEKLGYVWARASFYGPIKTMLVSPKLLEKGVWTPSSPDAEDRAEHPLQLIPDWTTSIVDAYALEDTLTTYTQRRRYLQALTSIVATPSSTGDYTHWWAEVHATPEQRSRAWLIVMTKGEE